MPSTEQSRWDVFRTIAQLQHTEWPAYGRHRSMTGVPLRHSNRISEPSPASGSSTTLTNLSRNSFLSIHWSTSTSAHTTGIPTQHGTKYLSVGTLFAQGDPTAGTTKQHSGISSQMISQRGLSYVVPKRMQTSEKAQAKRLLERGQDRYKTDRKLHLGDNEWHETTLVYRRKENAEHDDHRQYSVFVSNRGGVFSLSMGIGGRSRAATNPSSDSWLATMSKDFGLRFFYFASACLLYSIWRVVDLLAQVALTGEHGPMVTADNTLPLLKKETEIG